MQEESLVYSAFSEPGPMVSLLKSSLHYALGTAIFNLVLEKTQVQATVPGSSPGGSRELEGWTALAWKDLFVY